MEGDVSAGRETEDAHADAEDTEDVAEDAAEDMSETDKPVEFVHRRLMMNKYYKSSTWPSCCNNNYIYKNGLVAKLSQAEHTP